MLRALRDISIRRKLTVVMMATSGIVLLLASSGFVAYELLTFRSAMLQDLHVLARLTAENSAAALAFDDAAAAGENLAALTAQPSVTVGCIYETSGGLFAAYLRRGADDTCPDTPLADGFRFYSGHLVLAHPVVMDNEVLGTVNITAETREMRERVKRYAGIAALISVVAAVVALLLSTSLQRVISTPILELTRTATTIAEGKDYSVRAVARSADEIGVLTHAFNGMLHEIQQHSGALDAEVVERRRIEAELRRALAKEKELTELKSHFVSMASHEFRTPLTAILAASDTLRRYGERLTAAQRVERVNKIQAQVKHMTSLLEDVLALGRGDSGKLRCALEPVDLRALCQQLVQEAQMTAQATHTLLLEGTWPGGQVVMDPKLLRQILGNLLGNAIKYSPGGGTVGISVACDGSTAEFRVQDQGIGMSKADAERLFEPFHRGANVGKIAGSGLGLAITKKAVELHGGTIAVTSAPGVGTTFVVRLPSGAQGHAS
jgi:signal transduction histidine kinase